MLLFESVFSFQGAFYLAFYGIDTRAPTHTRLRDACMTRAGLVHATCFHPYETLAFTPTRRYYSYETHAKTPTSLNRPSNHAYIALILIIRIYRTVALPLMLVFLLVVAVILLTTPFFQEVLNRIRRELSQAENNNNVIYSKLIPAPHQVNPIGRAALAKATPLAFPASSKSPDLFAGIVPKTIQDAVARYESQREALVQAKVGRLRKATQGLNG